MSSTEYPLALVVGDVRAADDSLAVLSSKLRLETQTVPTADAAVKWAERNPTPDLIIFDVDMPFITGEEMVHRARAARPLSLVPCVLIVIDNWTPASLAPDEFVAAHAR